MDNGSELFDPGLPHFTQKKGKKHSVFAFLTPVSIDMPFHLLSLDISNYKTV